MSRSPLCGSRESVVSWESSALGQELDSQALRSVYLVLDDGRPVIAFRRQIDALDYKGATGDKQVLSVPVY